MKLAAIATIVYFALYCATPVLASCPNWCSKRGYCTSPGLDGYCDCEVGYTGSDCSLRICPKAYDTLTIKSNERRRTVRLKTNLKSGVLLGKFTFAFANSFVELQANANMVNNQSCINALLGLKSISNVDCVLEDVNTMTGSASYLITLLNYPTLPYENNIFYHDGNPALNLFKCNMSSVDFSEADTPYCEISDEVSTNLPLYAECGSRGVCNSVYGLCSCEKGFKGLACDDITDDRDIVSHDHDGPFFTGSLMHLNVQRESSKEFNLLSAGINNRNVTIIRGDRRMIHSGDAFVEGSIVASNIQHARMDVDLGDSNFLSIIEGRSTNHFQAVYNNDDVMTVSYDGSIVAKGSLSVNNGDVTAVDGAISAKSIRVSDNVYVDRNVYINKSMYITNDIEEADGVDERSSMLSLESKSSSYRGTMLELNDYSSRDTTVIRVTSNNVTTFKLASNGIIESSGLKMSSGGIVITSGGLAIKAGGLTVSGDLNVENGHVNIDNQDLKVSHLTISPSNKHGDKDSLLTLKNDNNNYYGSMIHLVNLQTLDKNVSPFSFITAKDKQGNSFFDVKSDGMLYSNSGAIFRGENGIKINHHSLLEGGASFNKVILDAKDVVYIPSNTSYVVISDDEHNFIESKIIFPKKGSGINVGQLLILTNNAVSRLVGDVTIPPMTTILLIYNGERWQSIDSLKTSTEELRNVKVLEVVNDISIGNFTLSAGSLRSTALSRGAVPVATGSGLLIDTKKMYFEKGILRIPNIRVSNLLSDLDAKGNMIRNAVLHNPKFQDSAITFDSIIIKNQRGLAFFNSTGHLTGGGSDTSTVEIQKLIVNMLNISEEINMNNNLIRNIRFDEKSIPVNAIKFDEKSIPASAIKFDDSIHLGKESDAARSDIELIGIDSFGKVVLFSDSKQQNYKYQHIDSHKISATEINLVNTKSASLLSTDSSGNIIEHKDALELNNNLVMKNGDIILTTNSKIVFPSATANSLLTVNSNGQIISASEKDTINIGLFTSDIIQVKKKLESPSIDASQVKVSGDILTANIEATGTAAFSRIKMHVETDEEFPLVSKSGFIVPSESIILRHVTADEVTSTKLVAKSIRIVHDLDAERSSNAFLSVDKEGNVKAAALPDSYSLKKISIDSIKSNVSETAFLYSDSSGNVKSTNMVQMSEDDNPPKLIINGASDLFGSVYVEGSLNVHGSVVGSGPYMDSSDKRFKSDVHNVSGADALARVKQLQAVSYFLNSKDYPSRNFDDGLQLGWIADGVETVVPELVSTDSEGFKAVSYSRSAVLIAEALKEVEAAHRTRIESLERDIKLLMDNCSCARQSQPEQAYSAGRSDRQDSKPK